MPCSVNEITWVVLAGCGSGYRVLARGDEPDWAMEESAEQVARQCAAVAGERVVRAVGVAPIKGRDDRFLVFRIFDAGRLGALEHTLGLVGLLVPSRPARSWRLGSMLAALPSPVAVQSYYELPSPESAQDENPPGMFGRLSEWDDRAQGPPSEPVIYTEDGESAQAAATPATTEPPSEAQAPGENVTAGDAEAPHQRRAQAVTAPAPVLLTAIRRGRLRRLVTRWTAIAALLLLLIALIRSLPWGMPNVPQDPPPQRVDDDLKAQLVDAMRIAGVRTADQLTDTNHAAAMAADASRQLKARIDSFALRLNASDAESDRSSIDSAVQEFLKLHDAGIDLGAPARIEQAQVEQAQTTLRLLDRYNRIVVYAQYLRHHDPQGEEFGRVAGELLDELRIH